MWLREEFTGGMAFFPDASNTSFDIPFDDSPATLLVEGQDVARHSTPTGEATADALASGDTVLSPQTGTLAARPGNAAGPSHAGTPAYRRPPPTCTVKVVKAKFRRLPGGKPEFTPVGQLFVDLTDSSANIDHVLAAVKRQWGHDQVVVTADGLRIEDSAGTQGM